MNADHGLNRSSNILEHAGSCQGLGPALRILLTHSLEVELSSTCLHPGTGNMTIHIYSIIIAAKASFLTGLSYAV